jgi:hypothetical protein
MRLDHDAHMAAIGLPTRNPFEWRVDSPEPVQETAKQRNRRMSRDRYRAGQTPDQKKKAMRVNPESSLGYNSQAVSDRNLSIRGRG